MTTEMRTFRVRIVRVAIKPGWSPRITDHAVVRFLERSMGIDVEAIRTRLRTPAVRTAILSGASSVKFENVRLILANAAVVTVVDGVKKARTKGPRRPTRKQMEVAEEADA